jgi:hypothetical protein
MDIWNTVTYTRQKHTQQPEVQQQQQQPILTIVNRYVLLNIQQEDSEDSQSSGRVGEKTYV